MMYRLDDIAPAFRAACERWPHGPDLQQHYMDLARTYEEEGSSLIELTKSFLLGGRLLDGPPRAGGYTAGFFQPDDNGVAFLRIGCPGAAQPARRGATGQGDQGKVPNPCTVAEGRYGMDCLMTRMDEHENEDDAGRRF